MKTASRFVSRKDKQRGRQRRLLLEQLEPRIVLDGKFWLSALAVTGSAGAPFDKLEVEFSNAVDQTTFDAVDVTLARAGVDIHPAAITDLGNNRFEVDFGGQTSKTNYALVIGPAIQDLASQAMDQNRDGTAGDPYQAALFTANLGIPDGDTTYDGQSLILYGNTATIDGQHSFADVQVLDGAVLTHSAATETEEFRLDLTVYDTVLVDATSAIDVSNRGYMAGRTLGNTTVGGATGRAGGSYGGLGGTANGETNWVYSDFRDPNQLGSGGGPGRDRGGGLARITADTLNLDGAIRAVGGQTGGGQFDSPPPGSGGGIRLDVGTLRGSGSISANGGYGHWGAEGGGGGRVAVYYDTLDGFDLEANVSAYGGGGDNTGGSSGTVYLHANGGEDVLIVRRGDYHPAPNAWTPLWETGGDTLGVARLEITGDGLMVAPDDPFTIDAQTIVIQDNATLEVATPDPSDTAITAETVNLLSGGALSHRAATETEEYSLRIAATTVSVDATSAIDVSNQGYMAGRTLGNTTVGGATGRAGGSYGGLGGNGNVNGQTNWVYGNFRDPGELGSGGGPGRDHGGGLVRIVADTLNLDGAIRAVGGQTGGPQFDSPPPGSGGGIRLDVGTLRGSGSISADGGYGHWGAEGGGGGRVAIYYDTLDGFDLGANVSAYGGGGDNAAGSSGTVYLHANGSEDVLIVRRGDYHPDSSVWTPLDDDDGTLDVARLEIAGEGLMAASADRLTIRADDVLVTDGVTLELASDYPEPGFVGGDVTVQNGSVLTHRKTTIDDEYYLRIIADSLTVDDTSRIDAVGRGYERGHTLGNTTEGAASHWAGGSYGGLGTAVRGAPNGVYGDAANPKHLGSGGAGQWWHDLGDGGGSAQITANTVTLDGAIQVDGTVNDVAGSGGSVRLNVGTLVGTGTVSANGGNGEGDFGSGGGGRIAIYAHHVNTLPTENVTANGGTGRAGDAEDGTVVYPTEPLLDWDRPTDAIWHGTERLRWTGLGFDPATVTVDVEAFSGLDVYPIAAGLPPVGHFDWDTTGVPDERYEVRATFRDSVGDPLGTLRCEDVLINNAVVWHEGVIRANETWAGGLVHALEKPVKVAAGVTLSIDPGAIVKFAEGTGITVADGATLNAPATDVDPIVITLLTDDTIGGDTNLDVAASRPCPGQSPGIQVPGGGQANLTEFVELRYVAVTHSGTISEDQVWPGFQLHHVTGDITVPDGVTLTIEPGAVVKVNEDVKIVVERAGQLVADGTVAEPITVTSVHDDTIGGDTAGNGDATAPAAGDWLGIYADGGHVTLDHVHLLYGGGSTTGSWNWSGALRTTAGGTLAVNASILRDAFYDGIRAETGPVTFTNTLIVDADRGVSAAGGQVNLINCTLDGNRIGAQAHGAALSIVNTLITNSLVYGTDWDNGAAPTVRYSNVWGSGTADFHNHFGQPDPVPGLDGIISADPRYKNSADGNYRLNYLSPAIDAGDGSVAPVADFMDAPRYDDPRTQNTGTPPDNGFVDMGAYEFVETAESDVDLVVSSVSGPIAAMVGNVVQVQWVITNAGQGVAVGPWHDQVGVIADPELGVAGTDPQDVLVGQGVTLGPGQSFTASAQITVPGVIMGEYFWHVATNVRGEVFEGRNYDNNATHTLATVAIDVPELPITGVARQGTFDQPGQTQWFRFSPGEGNDVRIALDLLGDAGTTELYIRRQYLPTPQKYEFRQSQWNSADVSAIATDTTDHTYYVAAVAKSLTSTPTGFQVSAESAGFELYEVNPSTVGNSGSVTLELFGAGFVGETMFHLENAASQQTPAVMAHVIDSGHALATFDLETFQPGAATVVAQQPGGTTSMLDQGVNVVPGGEGNLDIQLSVPERLRLGRSGTWYVTVSNTGLVDLPIPWVGFQVTGAQSIYMYESTVNWGDTVVALGINDRQPYSRLRPGEQFTYEYRVTPGPGDCMEARAGVIPGERYPTPIDWSSIPKPPEADPVAWQVEIDGLYERLGSTLGDLYGLLLDELHRFTSGVIRYEYTANLNGQWVLGREATEAIDLRAALDFPEEPSASPEPLGAEPDAVAQTGANLNAPEQEAPYPGKPADGIPKTYFVVIMCAEYREFDLPGVEFDWGDVMHLLGIRRTPEKHVKERLDKDGHNMDLIRPNYVVSDIKELQGTIDRDDTLAIIYSGDAGRTATQEGYVGHLELHGNDNIWSFERGKLSLKDLEDAIRAVKPGKVILINDSHYAGAFTNWLRPYAEKPFDTPYVGISSAMATNKKNFIPGNGSLFLTIFKYYLRMCHGLEEAFRKTQKDMWELVNEAKKVSKEFAGNPEEWQEPQLYNPNKLDLSEKPFKDPAGYKATMAYALRNNVKNPPAEQVAFRLSPRGA